MMYDVNFEFHDYSDLGVERDWYTTEETLKVIILKPLMLYQRAKPAFGQYVNLPSQV